VKRPALLDFDVMPANVRRDPTMRARWCELAPVVDGTLRDAGVARDLTRFVRAEQRYERHAAWLTAHRRDRRRWTRAAWRAHIDGRDRAGRGLEVLGGRLGILPWIDGY
jgi:hypothetical protein